MVLAAAAMVSGKVIQMANNTFCNASALFFYVCKCTDRRATGMLCVTYGLR